VTITKSLALILTFSILPTAHGGTLSADRQRKLCPPQVYRSTQIIFAQCSVSREAAQERPEDERQSRDDWRSQLALGLYAKLLDLKRCQRSGPLAAAKFYFALSDLSPKLQRVFQNCVTYVDGPEAPTTRQGLARTWQDAIVPVECVYNDVVSQGIAILPLLYKKIRV